jgi:hypothetical protein
MLPLWRTNVHQKPIGFRGRLIGLQDFPLPVAGVDCEDNAQMETRW